MTTRQTTIAADVDDLALLQQEADRRDVTLSLVLSEAVAAAAGELRQSRRPRFGMGHSGAGGGAARAAAEHPDEPFDRASPRS